MNASLEASAHESLLDDRAGHLDTDPRVFVVTNFSILLESMRCWLREVGCEVVGGATSYDDALATLGLLDVDVVLVDIDSDRELIGAFVGQVVKTTRAKVITLTRSEDNDYRDRMIMRGARGVLDHSSTPEDVLVAILKVCRGELWLDPAATGRVFATLAAMAESADRVGEALSRCTRRELEVLSYVLEHGGASGKQLASGMHLSESTLRNHLSAIYEKLGVRSRHALMSYAHENGVAERLERLALPR